MSIALAGRMNATCRAGATVALDTLEHSNIMSALGSPRSPQSRGRDARGYSPCGTCSLGTEDRENVQRKHFEPKVHPYVAYRREEGGMSNARDHTTSPTGKHG